ncbi:MAG TPA: hypothetical protein VGE21_03550 [Flavobacteriales bacterium]
MRFFPPLGALALTVLPFLSIAQTKTDKAEVQWGQPRDMKVDGDFLDVEEHVGDDIFVTVRRKKDIWLQKIGTDLKVQREQALPLEMGRDEHSWEALLFQGDQIHLFTTFYDKSERTNSLYVRSYKQSDLSPVSGIRKVHTIKALGKRAKGAFAVQDIEGKRIRVSIFIPIDDDEEKRRTEVLMFDSGMNSVEPDAIDRVMPYADDEYDVEGSIYDTDGTYIMVVHKYLEKMEKKERRKDKKPQYDLMLLIYPPGSSTATIQKLEVQGKFIHDIRFLIPEESGAPITCAGFYGNKGTSGVRGAFFLQLDRRNKEIVHQSLKEFDHDFITQYMTEKEEKKAEKRAERKDEELEMFSYDLDDIILRDDGGAVLVAEQYYMFTSTVCTTTQGGGQSCRTIYHYVYNDIMVVSADKDMNIEWAQKIPKRQHTTNDGGFYSSYALTVKGDRLYFVFNDSGENLFLKPGMKVQQFELKGKDALITLATVDSDGNVTREALMTPEKRDAILKPKDCVQMRDDRLFIYAQRKKESRYGFITFD